MKFKSIRRRLLQWGTGSAVLSLYVHSISFGQASRTLGIERRAPEQQAKVDTDLNSAPRHALVIGNSRYLSVSPLRNPANDAGAMAEQLADDGFEVELRRDITRNAMIDAITKYATHIAQTRSVGLFYYAGHGLQLAWRNFLVPVDASLSSAEDIPSRCVDLSLLISGISKANNPMNIVVLDACRDNPFASVNTGGRGLSQIDAPPGSLLAFATSPGNVASDGEGANGLYTENLLRELKVPEARIEDVFKRVRLRVRLSTGGQQIPWESTSLEDDFYFLPPRAGSFMTQETDRIRRQQAAFAEKRRAEEQAAADRKLREEEAERAARAADEKARERQEAALREEQRARAEAERRAREEKALQEALAAEAAALERQQAAQRAQQEAERRRKQDQAEKAAREAEAEAQRRRQTLVREQQRAQEEAERRRRQELALAEARAAEEAARERRQVALREQQRAEVEAESRRREEETLKKAQAAEAAVREKQMAALREQQRAEEEAERKRRLSTPVVIIRPNEAEVNRRYQQEVALWNSVKSTNEAAPLADYLQRYPSGNFAELIQLRLDQILAAQGEKKIRADTAATPYSAGTGVTDTGYKVGDVYSYRILDILSRGETSRFTRAVTRVTPEEVYYSNNEISDLLGNPILDYFGIRSEIPQQVFPLEYRIGKRWTTSSRFLLNGRPGEYTMSFVVLAREKIGVPAGTFNAFRIEGRGNATVEGIPRSIERRFWIAPDDVRQVIAQEEVRRVSSGRGQFLGRADRIELLTFKQS